MPVAVLAADPMDIVGAFGVEIGGIHFLDVETTIGHARVAVLAGRARVLIVSAVAGKTAEPFVDTDRGAIVARAELRSPIVERRGCTGIRLPRCVALIAQG